MWGKVAWDMVGEIRGDPGVLGTWRQEMVTEGTGEPGAGEPHECACVSRSDLAWTSGGAQQSEPKGKPRPDPLCVLAKRPQETDFTESPGEGRSLWVPGWARRSAQGPYKWEGGWRRRGVEAGGTDAAQVVRGWGGGSRSQGKPLVTPAHLPALAQPCTVTTAALLTGDHRGIPALPLAKLLISVLPGGAGRGGPGLTLP